MQALMNVNTRLRELYTENEELFDIVLMTNNHAQVGVRLINSINHYGMLSAKPNIVDCVVWWRWRLACCCIRHNQEQHSVK